MDNVRIAILSTQDDVYAFIDNNAPDALHYYDDELHTYLQGAAATFGFKCSADHDDSQFLTEGNKISFVYNGRDYYFNIVRVVRDEFEIEVEAYSLSFELINEYTGAYKGEKMSFEQYLAAFDFEKILTVGINEVSDKRISNEWTGNQTILARIFSLANVFGAEAEFVPELDKNYSLKRIVLNIYREHSDAYQGIGKERTDIVLRYGHNVKTIRKTSDITDLYTAIRPIGKDNLNLAGYVKQEKDSAGNVEYDKPAEAWDIRAVQARDRFPSNLVSQDRYIVSIKEYDTDNKDKLYSMGLSDLKENCVPKVTYEIEGYFDTGIGDTVQVEDDEFNPVLYLSARVTEQVISFTKPDRNKTTFSNIKELQSQISDETIKRMQALIDANKTYTCMISTDNGIVFRNGEGTTTLTANVRDAGTDLTDKFTIQWSKDGEVLATGKSIVVQAASVADRAVYRFDALDASGNVKGFYEVTVTNVDYGTGAQYILESSDEFIRRELDGTLSRSYIDFCSFYRIGNNAENHSFPGKFVIEETEDGYHWETVYESAESESSVRYFFMWVFGDSEGNALIGDNGDDSGDAIGSNFRDVLQLRCRLYAPDGSNLLGVKNVTVLKDGEPTGVTESVEEPTVKFEGMLWKCTGEVEGIVQNATYRWNGTEWDVYKLSVENLDVKNLSAITADLGTINAGEIILQSDDGSTERITKIENSGKITSVYKQYNVVNGEKRYIKIDEAVFDYGKIVVSTDRGGVKYAAELNGEYLNITTSLEGVVQKQTSIGASFSEYIGNVSNLKTSNKSLVGAINELHDKIGG